MERSLQMQKPFGIAYKGPRLASTGNGSEAVGYTSGLLTKSSRKSLKMGLDFSICQLP